MVTRKPVPTDNGLAPTSFPPYPVTPSSPNSQQAPYLQDDHDSAAAIGSGSESANVWGDERVKQQQPVPEIPLSLRVGPPGYAQYGSEDISRPKVASTNPYLQRQTTGQNENKESSAAAWGGFGERPAQPTGAPPVPPIPSNNPPLNDQLHGLSISDSSTNPWQPALDEKASSANPPLPPLQTQNSGNGVWSAPPPNREAPSVPEQPVLIDMEEPESPAWDEEEPSPTVQEMPPDNAREERQIMEGQQAWDEGRSNSGPTQPLSHTDPAPQNEGWNLIDHEPMSESSAQQSGVVRSDGSEVERYPTEEHPPILPPRASQEVAPPQPPRPVIDTSNRSASSLPSPNAAAAKKQKKETYEIKKISWHDVTSGKNPRVSPILVQNANGPCPLLALVNALTLSTPADVETALVECLRSREQVSLGLLLDAVFDELMSGRRGDAAHELPDVSDLYSFLITLHTGMNVNPRFVPAASTDSPIDPRNSMSHLHPIDRESSTPGSFEETREMTLYSTFSVPLIHGWLPAIDSPAHAALKRSSPSYEDAQNLFFREEELEDKLQREGLSFQEQGTLEDISTIKAFFDTAATQLTPYGLDTITTWLAPGSVAILFRNDHFSTLYRHPETLQLLQLVTDMGYAGHEEVVWESLIDVNGENAEFFSGDFRLVGGAPATPNESHSQRQSQSNEQWTTVPVRNQNQARRQNLSAPTNDGPPATPQSPNHEQEDHDLALALQLQEEEEVRHQEEVSRRQRETELSQQFIEQQGRNTNVPVNTRGGGMLAQNGARNRTPNGPARVAVPEVRPSIPPRRNGPQGQPIGGEPIDPEAGVDLPPPSYEQAATRPAYVPPTNHPSHPSSSPNAQRHPSAYGANAQNYSGSPNPRTRRGTGPTLVEQIDGRRRQASSSQPGLTAQQQEERSKDCIVM